MTEDESWKKSVVAIATKRETAVIASHKTIAHADKFRWDHVWKLRDMEM